MDTVLELFTFFIHSYHNTQPILISIQVPTIEREESLL